MMCEVPSKPNAKTRARQRPASKNAQLASGTLALPGSEFRDGGDFPVMIELPAGEFIMGENEGDKFANDTERPAHRVKLSVPFALGKFPVTVGEFQKFRSNRSFEDSDALPVIRVSWDDAVAYCEWLSEQTGRPYRLPSEAEWEFACRAGSRTPFACGNEISPSDANYFYDEDGTRVGLGHRTPVGGFPGNRFGLHDLHGNVCEWVADAWHADYTGAPADGTAWGASEDERRVIRGGAWDYLPRLLRSSWRDWRLVNQRADNIGFRVATSGLKNLRVA
jgi:formylglycine-generating enzyme required for sulfatase activity